jgi:amino acid transporter
MYTLYTMYFITLYTSTSNSIQTGYYVLLAAKVKPADMSVDLICFIGVVMTTGICLLMLFSSLQSRRLNVATAVLKVLLLIAVICLGGWYVSNHQANAGTGWSIGSPEPNWTSGIFLVFFSYHGWENATYVSWFRDHQTV